jgi:predicted transcriptional regulator
MEKQKYETVAVEPQIKEEIRELARKQGKKIYAIIAEALAEYKKNLA